MKLALISDVHANAVALEAVLDDIDGQGVDWILSAGDVVGYYPYPNQTVDLFRKREMRSIAGNHDVAVMNVDPTGMNPLASKAILWTARQLTMENRAYLMSLRRHTVLRAGRLAVGLFHGSPRDDDEYLYEEDASLGLLDMSRCDVLVLGHTHIPYARLFEKGAIINPGSVGQPRDGEPLASYTLFDTTMRRAENRRVAFDIDQVASRVREEGLPKDLGTRLYYGY